MRRQGIDVECLMQVHDALVLEYPVPYRDDITEVVMDAMVNTVQMAVPIKASVDYGFRLGEL